MKKLGISLLLLLMILAACGPAPIPVTTTIIQVGTAAATQTPGPRSITVFAAASLTGAFTEMGKDFETANPNVRVNFNFAGSQTLGTQIIQGAQVDMFASANHDQMTKVIATNLIDSDAVRDFATNQLVVILPANNPANLQSLQDLAKPGLKLVLADATVPAGQYARQVLDNLSKDPAYSPSFGTQVLANVVSNETDVKQVVSKVQLGEADAGIVYVSDAVAAPELKTIAIPAADNVVAKYPLAILENAPDPELASDFQNYIFSAAGQAILKKWGFTPIAP